MAEPSPDRVVIGTIGPLITTVIGAAIGWLPGGLTGAIGSPLTVLLAAVGGISGLAFSLMYKRYIGVLGAGGEAKGSPEQKSYDALRRSLRGGNIAARLYAEWLTKFLDAVDRSFGDAGSADQTLFPRAFGLKTPAPLWTAPAFDRCLLLALLYPIVAVFIMWAISGHVGPAEVALGLRQGLSGGIRGVTITATAFSMFAYWQSFHKSGWSRSMWLSGAAVSAFVGGIATAVALAFAVAFTITFAFSFAVTVVDAGAVVGARAGIGAIAASVAVAIASYVTVFVISASCFVFGLGVGGIVAVVASAVFGAARINEPIVIAVAVIFTAAAAFIFLEGGGVAKVRESGILKWPGVFLVSAVLIMTSGCQVLAHPLQSPSFWGSVAGPVLLFLVLLTLLNAPFDWAALGLTRALLRRGLELGGWWPYFLALADALAAAFIIALLAITMVVGVQTFDRLAEHSGGADARVLPLDKLFDGITAQPAAPEYWWVYALLLSTMIPSLLNLMISGASLLRGIPGLPALLLRFMPAGKAVPAFDRPWLALVLTCQVFAGAIFGIAAQFVLAIGVIFYVLPWMGLELLDTARTVAEFDLPGRVLGLWWGDP